VTIPLFGVLANRTRTRWGKYRPYLMFGSLPLAASFVLMFAPVQLDGWALIAYALATQALFRTTYAVVNIPAAQVEAVESGYVASRHAAVVGKLERATPEITSKVQEINFNPYWNVPKTIDVKDIDYHSA
jgi:hypothetical protein